MTLCSVGLYAALFLLMQAAEMLWPEQYAGRLLHWDSAAFCVGVPASLFGTSYVLTVRNPQNYTGFYAGILMALLLAVQCFLQEQYDLTVLYIFVFIPFLSASLVRWRKALCRSEKESFTPAFLNRRLFALTLATGCLIVAADYVLSTWVLAVPGHRGEWLYNMAEKILGGVMMASALIANFWMISKKNDAWIGWVVYCVAGLLLFAMAENVFSVLLFIVMLAVNVSAQVSWIRNTPSDARGWTSFNR